MGKLFIRRLQADPNMDRFDCGNRSINDKIKNGYYATLLKEGYAYEVCLSGVVIGHYMVTIVPLQYHSDYTIGEGKNSFTAIKLEYLAIDRLYQHFGNGTQVLKYIIQEAKEYSEKIPIRFLSIDALAEKVDWYIDRGFQLYNPDDRNHAAITVPMYVDFCDMIAVEAYCDSCE